MVGHLTEDRTPDGPRLGGAAAYAGLLAHRFGVPTTILTAADKGFPFLEPLRGIRVVSLPSAARTRFENRYADDGARRQRLLSRADTIPEAVVSRTVARLPPGSAVLHAPVANELGGAARLPRPTGEGHLAGAIPQGLLRRWDAAGRVSLCWPKEAADRLAGLDLVSLAEEEAPSEFALPVAILAITHGPKGVTLGRPGRPDIAIPAVRASAVDPTGAGDVFAAALFVLLWSGLPIRSAGGLAVAAAAVSVEAPGTEGIPTFEEAAVRRVSG